MNNETYNLQNDGTIVDGFSRVNRIGNQDGRWGHKTNPVHVARVAEAAVFLLDVLKGKAPTWALKEAIAPTWPGQSDVVVRSNYPKIYSGVSEAYSTSDFPNLMGDVLDRMMINNFNSLGHNYRAYVKVGRPLSDFRTVRRMALNGAEGQYQKITEQDALKYSTTLAEDNYTYEPDLYGLGVRLTFRAIMNDDLSAFDDIPQRLGRGGRRTIERFVTELFFDASGPHASYFSAGNGNVITGNPALDITALGDAFELLLGFTDADAEPILVDGVTLLYGPSLHVTANNLMNMLTVDHAEAGGSTNRVVRTNNWIVRNINLVMNPYIPIVASTANGATSWGLFANPNTGRPAGEIGFLSGFEQPVLFQKTSNAQRIGGGIDISMGDFATMETSYKGVLGIGGSTLEPLSAVASNGSGA